MESSLCEQPGPGWMVGMRLFPHSSRLPMMFSLVLSSDTEKTDLDQRCNLNEPSWRSQMLREVRLH